MTIAPVSALGADPSQALKQATNAVQNQGASAGRVVKTTAVN
jgi:hypothetical protein